MKKCIYLLAMLIFGTANSYSQSYYGQGNGNCFTNDASVWSYLVGKTFKSKDGKTKIKFDYSGASVNGGNYRTLLSNTKLGGYKGVIKLASTNVNNPNGVLKLWISCRENAVTDGTMVLLYD